MRRNASLVTAAGTVVASLGALSLRPRTAAAADAPVAGEEKKIASERKQGNCL